MFLTISFILMLLFFFIGLYFDDKAQKTRKLILKRQQEAKCVLAMLASIISCFSMLLTYTL